MELIKLKEVGKKYYKKSVLEDVNISIEAGEILGVIGQSGSGKTTLLNLIAGFIEPTSGEVVYVSKIDHKERELHKNLHKLKKNIGFTPQHNSLYPKLTVKENLVHFGKLYKIKKTILNENINSLLKFTQLSNHKNKLVEHLSGGMQKRLDISCSLIHKPKILLLDEPTADLDPILQKEVLHLLQEVNKQGITIVIASHHLEGIENICTKIAIVHQGKVHTHGQLDEIRKPFLRDHFTIKVHSGERKEELIRRLKTLSIRKIVDHKNRITIYPSDIEKATNELLNIIKEEKLHLHDMDLRKPTLNEIFERIVTQK